MFTTPILIVIFNRENISKQLFDRIRVLTPKKLYIAADGPRLGRTDDIESCEKTRAVFDNIDWECDVFRLFRTENVGCGIGVSSAISWFFEHEEQGIILEDDCLPDLSFFSYCESLLHTYKDDSEIFSISGTNLQNGKVRGEGSYYFSHYPGIWGWATWRRAWSKFKHDFEDLEETFNKGSLDHVFQSASEKQFWLNVFLDSKSKKHSIWDNYWLYCMWKEHGFGLVSNQNLITNVGFDNSGTHFFLKDSFREPVVKDSIKFPLKHPKKEINRVADKFIFEHLYYYSFGRIIRILKENGIITCFRYFVNKISEK